MEAHAETQRAALAPTRLGCDTFVVVVTTPFSIVRSAYVSCGGAGASASNVCPASTVASPVMSSWLGSVAGHVEPRYAGRPPSAEREVHLQTEAVGLGQDGLDGGPPVRVAVLVLVRVDDVVGAVHHEGDLHTLVAGLLDLASCRTATSGSTVLGHHQRNIAPVVRESEANAVTNGCAWAVGLAGLLGPRGPPGRTRDESQPAGDAAGGDEELASHLAWPASG